MMNILKIVFIYLFWKLPIGILELVIGFVLCFPLVTLPLGSKMIFNGVKKIFPF